MADDATGAFALIIEEAGAGRPVLVLHGGGGPRTVVPIAAHLAEYAHVLPPTLPGWNGAERPVGLGTAAEYADLYLDYLRQREVEDVVVIGSSLGGWLAAEMAVRDQDGLLGAIAVLDAAGIEVEGEPITDFFSLDPRGVAEHSWYDPDKFFIDPATLTADQIHTQQANMATMAAVFRDMYDPELREQLAGVTIPALVIWGDSDRIFTPGYGHAYAASFANARFEVVAEAGHLPQLEQPQPTLALIDAFLGHS